MLYVSYVYVSYVYVSYVYVSYVYIPYVYVSYVICFIRVCFIRVCFIRVCFIRVCFVYEAPCFPRKTPSNAIDENEIFGIKFLQSFWFWIFFAKGIDCHNFHHLFFQRTVCAVGFCVCDTIDNVHTFYDFAKSGILPI